MTEPDINARRLERRVKKMAAKQLPYALNTAALADQAPDLDRERGIGRVIQDLMTATQGNFDHLRAELERSGMYHNEHADETNYMKSELLPHAHAQMSSGVAPGHGTYHAAGFGGGEQVNDTYLSSNRFVPFFIDQPCTISRLLIDVAVAGTSDLRMAIYAGDNEGHYPGTLIHDAGLIDGSVVTEAQSAVFEAEVGPGWHWVGGEEQPQAGTSVQLGGWNTTTPGINPAPMSSFWPFPTLETGFSAPGVLGISLVDWVSDAAPPAWAGDYPDAFLYTQLAPLINFKVK